MAKSNLAPVPEVADEQIEEKSNYASRKSGGSKREGGERESQAADCETMSLYNWSVATSRGLIDKKTAKEVEMQPRHVAAPI